MRESRRRKVFWTLMVIALIYATVVSVAGLYGVWMNARDPAPLLHDIAVGCLMTAFLPVALVGLSRSSLAAKFLFAGAVSSVVVFALMGRSRAHVVQAEAFSGEILVALPMLAVGALLLWKSRWKEEPRIGSVRTFGKWGPMYEITAMAQSEDGGKRVAIHGIESGERTTYSLKYALNDPLKP